MKYKFIVFRPSSKLWIWHAQAVNGRLVAWAGEGYTKRSHAIKMAKAMAAGRPVFVRVGDKLIPA